ncbi:MAG TPA: hypothetical protein VFW69_04940 [Mycobacterium sp.]|nr:hypothetical protein [Mycobacterium sp.]
MAGQSVVDSTIGINIQIGGSVTGDLRILLDRTDYRLELLAPSSAGEDRYRDIDGLPLRAIPATFDDQKRARSAYPQRL